MIRGVIVMNTQGKPRFAKFYDFQPVEKQLELIRSIYGVLCSRAENVSNFLEAESHLRSVHGNGYLLQCQA
ncbi:AP-3 complex subunit sigma, partial [Cucurbita argyrosperma subsp. argyrosperma]